MHQCYANSIKPILDIEGLTLGFCGIQTPGSIISVISPKETRKTSLLNTISKFCRTSVGSVHFFCEDITRHRPPIRARLGLVDSCLNISLFLGMTVLDNIHFGRYYHLLSKGRDRDDRKITTAMKMRHSSIYKAYSAEIEIIYAGGCTHA